MANKDIRRIVDTIANIRDNLSEGKTAIATDATNHVYRIGSDIYFPALSRKQNRTTMSVTWIRESFAGLDIIGAADVALFINQTGDGNIAEFAKDGEAVFTVSDGKVDVSGGALLLSSILSAGLGGTTEESAVEVDITGKNNVKLSPDDDENYYEFSGTPHDGQVVVVSNISASFAGYINGNALGASSSALFIYVGDGIDEWRIL